MRRLWNWSCELWSNERPEEEKNIGRGQTHRHTETHTDIATYKLKYKLSFTMSQYHLRKGALVNTYFY